MTSDPNAVTATDNLTPSESGSHSHLPRAKLTALARLKSFGGSFVSSRDAPPPIVFPPPSWELSDELLGKPAPRAPALLESNYSKVETPEAVPFAKKLRALIESLPISLPGTSSQHEATASAGAADADSDAPDDGRQGSPVPPGLDPGLMRMLSSESLMNGTPAGAPAGPDSAPARPGVWNILASLRRGGTGRPRTSAVEEEEGGVMLYAPLEPRTDSQLALADSETVLEYADPDAPTPRKSSEGNVPRVAKHVWVPSTTELSLLTTWWGYRLYLPPPVMAKLDGTSLQATARAAMVTAALRWVLDKIPIMLVPAQFRPAVKMLKQLGPLVGYVGVFIAWSWDRVRACDKGAWARQRVVIY